MLSRRSVLAFAPAILTGIAFPRPAGAQAAPNLRMVVPYAAGGPTDIQARLLGEHLGRSLNQSVVVENRTGAGVVVGTDAVAKAAPDGRTILLTTVAHAVNPSLFPSLPFNTERDFAPVALVAKVPLVVLVRNDLPARNIPELIAWIRERGGQASYGSAGIGSAPHLGTALFLMMAGTEALHVPYRGSGPALTDLAAGRLDFYIDAAASGLAQARGGTVRAIGWSMLRRSSIVPDLPTLDEQGVRGYEAYTWSALFVPAATPKDIVLRLNGAVHEALTVPALRMRFAEIGAELVEPAPPEALGAFVKDEIAKWREVVKKTGMSVQ
ncbi:MAG: tripartite tricarboxylate transporter substrate binding protein [Phreatobacter sp.]|uniref:tripartite tricarboxylate transporter substrate binding protein n=1 Tax=Phreatobacter sp. TaxID=1966341 RepID=UPI001A427F90|nr:tripartite tricarboxylate transporter substrate binding protein [Phreatobacter sp.]MBL8571279.1 tripartite tricarboxylate transporter substrate binding protein [Phreatobacter sp.]